MLKLLPVFAFIALVASLLALTPIRREIVYKLGISGDSTTSCCQVSDVLSQSGKFDYTANSAIFDNQVIDYPQTSLAQAIQNGLTRDSQVLGTTNVSGEEKWIEINLSEQRLKAYEGSRIVMEFPISSGKWAPTPTGTFYIWYKTRSQKMEGGNPSLGTYYNLPNVPHNMFFYQGYAIHGAYWHNNFGHPMSHGCVNSPLDQVAQLFEWTGPVVPEGAWVARASTDNPGTKVVVQ